MFMPSICLVLVLATNLLFSIVQMSGGTEYFFTKISFNMFCRRDQVLDFIEQVVLQNTPNSFNGCVVAGNSLGGFTALVNIL